MMMIITTQIGSLLFLGLINSSDVARTFVGFFIYFTSLFIVFLCSLCGGFYIQFCILVF